ncbi:hypothetical protein P8452_20284 [Trifolium repens]|nr:hypothetical protein P8452_20284 [Trifolium repens]
MKCYAEHKDTLKNRRKSSNKQGASVSSLLLQLLSTSLQQVREVKKEKESLSNHLRYLVWFSSVQFN